MSDAKDAPVAITSTWNENIEKIIKEIGDSCQGYKWMNLYIAEENSSLSNYIAYSLMILGTLSGILSTLSLEEADYTKGFRVVVTIGSFFSPLLVGILKKAKFEEKETIHQGIANKYANLEGNIRRQLSLYRHDRVNAGEYLEWVTRSYDELFANTPLIPKWLYEKWLKYADQQKIAISAVMGKYTDIKINTDVQCPKPTVEILIAGNDTLRKSPDFSAYSDKNMEYEMRRLARK